MDEINEDRADVDLPPVSKKQLLDVDSGFFGQPIALGDNTLEPAYIEDDPDFWTEHFNKNIYANALHFGAGHPVQSYESRALFLVRQGRENEAFEKDE